MQTKIDIGKSWLVLFSLPFLMGAVTHFFDAWVYIPADILMGIIWLGACTLVAEDHRP